MFSTYLYVTEEKLVEKIQQCKDSATLPRVSEYLKQHQIAPEQVKMAVLVQKMVDSDISGVCFTKNPVTGSTDDIIIEAIFGQGELLVSGQVTPDNYTFSKTSERITSRRVATQKIILTQESHSIRPLEVSKQSLQKLSDIHITLLALQAKKIEKEYGSPVDIEWAVEKGKLYFLQVRPITT
jgi:pyruvate,water dikinase